MRVWKLRNDWDVLRPGVYRQMLSFDENIMLMIVKIHPGACVPKHSHSNLQTGVVIKGKLLFRTDRGEMEISEGWSYYIAPNESHEVYNTTDREAVALDIFMPKRDDYTPYTRPPDVSL
ncbi:MAG: cupin domain-containing protein [Nitrososphaerota archaeon]